LLKDTFQDSTLDGSSVVSKSEFSNYNHVETVNETEMKILKMCLSPMACHPYRISATVYDNYVRD
jgi:hypothetical protein